MSIKATLLTRKVRLLSDELFDPALIDAIGAYTFIGNRVLLGPALKGVGRFCSIAQDAVLGPNQHDMALVSTSSCFYTFDTADDFYTGNRNAYSQQREAELNASAVILADDVWVGAKTIVLAGVHLGQGCVVGAGAVVTKNVPPYAIVVGNPARVIRYRFSPQIITTLLGAKIYQRNPDALFSLFKLFKQRPLPEHLDAFLEALQAVPVGE